VSARRGPRLARWLASVLLPAEDRDFVLGDLEELHRTRVRRHGRLRAALATRRALGASSGRLGRERLMESALLAAVGAAGGVGVAWLLTLPFRGEQLVRMPAFEGFSVDARVLAFAGVAALATAVLFWAAPAALAGRFDLGAAMREAGGQKTGRLGRLRWIAASAQIGLSLTLVVGALLLARTVHGLYRTDTGFSIERVSRVSVVVGLGGAYLRMHRLRRGGSPAR